MCQKKNSISRNTSAEPTIPTVKNGTMGIPRLFHSSLCSSFSVFLFRAASTIPITKADGIVSQCGNRKPADIRMRASCPPNHFLFGSLAAQYVTIIQNPDARSQPGWIVPTMIQVIPPRSRTTHRTPRHTSGSAYRDSQSLLDSSIRKCI